MYDLLKKILFLIPPELSHQLSLTGLSLLERIGLLGLFVPAIISLPSTYCGLRVDNPVGLAAGLDKNADHIDALGRLGFGFIEVGTVTPRAQPGNPRPRLFRAVPQRAIVNRMGFNNKGVDHLVDRVKKRCYRGVLGINIGKNFDTPLEKAVDDYLLCMDKVYPYADYIVVNLSSPNTPGLRQLQFGDMLAKLLHSLKDKQQTLARQYAKKVPVLIKIAPDMTPEEIRSMARQFNEIHVDGVIATNTTTDKSALAGSVLEQEQGGLSGAPLFGRSTDVLFELRQQLDLSIPIIGVGGIVCGENAKDKINAGATLVQIYTGFIYKGPALIRECVNAIAAK